jgi:transposase-like protein
LTAKRDASAARRFFNKAMRYSDVPGTVTMDKSGANKAALDQLNAERDIPIQIRFIVTPEIAIQGAGRRA